MRSSASQAEWTWRLLQLTAVSSIAAIEAALIAMLTRVAGTCSTSDVKLGVAPAEAESLVRILRLLVDGGLRGVADAGLGSSNVLYLTLSSRNRSLGTNPRT